MDESPEVPDEPTGTDSDLEQDFGTVADLLSELSQPGRLPLGASPTTEPTPFDAEDVDGATNDWLLRVVETQGWLCLDQPLGRASAAPDIAMHLFRQVSPDPAESCFAVSAGGRVSPTALGLQHLETWLTRGVQHKAAFLELLDEDRSASDATAEWNLLWEEVGSQPRQPVAIDAKVDTWKIKAFSGLAAEGLLDLNPSYQRDVVWSNAESQLLIESVLRGIPLPSVILTQVEGKEEMQIVDGKQRLTAILRFMGHHPEGRARAKALDPDMTLHDANFRKFVREHQLKPRDLAERYLPFKTRKVLAATDPLFEVSGKYYCEIRNKSVRMGDQTVSVRKLFESDGADYLIPVILYRKTRIQDIHHVFSLYNKQGRKLNAEELRNAIFHHLEFTKLMLVLSGDRPRPDQLAPYLPNDVKGRIAEVGDQLESLGFGTARFRRTKVLCWACAILLHPPGDILADQPSTPSTASHINALMKAIGDPDGETHPLHHRPALVALARDVQSAILAHSDADDAWHPRFRTKRGVNSKWEELPLIGSLLACLILAALGRTEQLTGNVAGLHTLTGEMRAPEKTQNRTQWRHIAKVATSVMDLLGVSDADATAALEARYGYSCIPVIRKLSADA